MYQGDEAESDIYCVVMAKHKLCPRAKEPTIGQLYMAGIYQQTPYLLYTPIKSSNYNSSVHTHYSPLYHLKAGWSN